VLDTDTRALRMAMAMPYGPVNHYRHGSGGYNVHEVLIKEYNRKTRQVEHVERWALFKGKFPVHELLPVSDREACIEQAENWLKENEIVP